MKSQTVHFNKLPEHIKIRAKRQARRLNFQSLEEALLELVNRITIEGPEYWSLVYQQVKNGYLRSMTQNEQIVYQALSNWTNETFGYRRLEKQTGLSNSELKVIVSRLRSLGYIKKENKKYIIIKL